MPGATIAIEVKKHIEVKKQKAQLLKELRLLFFWMLVSSLRQHGEAPRMTSNQAQNNRRDKHERGHRGSPIEPSRKIHRCLLPACTPP